MHAKSRVLAAADLGSNSFHLVIARYVDGRLDILERLRETVRLGSKLDGDGHLDAAAMARALSCLERFGQRLKGYEAENVRAVGTHALRVARHRERFLDRASEALGHPVEVISGLEEARLIYLGVTQMMVPSPGRQLIVDVGGGSTEVVIGEGVTPLQLESVQMGCVSYSERYFPDGGISVHRFQNAREAVRRELARLESTYRGFGWRQAVGSSGAVRAVGQAISDLEGHLVPTITRAGLERLVQHALSCSHVGGLALPSVTSDLQPIFPGALAIIGETFAVLGIEEMRIADGSMREGLLFDMLRRPAGGYRGYEHRTVL